MCGQSEKNSLNSNNSSTCPNNMVNFGPLTAEICWRVWGTPANFNGFRILAALLHGTLVVGVSQTLQRWTEGATYIRQGGHHVGHWPAFLDVRVPSVSVRLCLRVSKCHSWAIQPYSKRSATQSDQSINQFIKPQRAVRPLTSCVGKQCQELVKTQQ